MSLISATMEGWKPNDIGLLPYHVELIGPYRLPQVTGSNGVASLSGPDGAVFQATVAQAEELCALANKGAL